MLRVRSREHIGDISVSACVWFLCVSGCREALVPLESWNGRGTCRNEHGGAFVSRPIVRRHPAPPPPTPAHPSPPLTLFPASRSFPPSLTRSSSSPPFKKGFFLSSPAVNSRPTFRTSSRFLSARHKVRSRRVSRRCVCVSIFFLGRSTWKFDSCYEMKWKTHATGPSTANTIPPNFKTTSFILLNNRNGNIKFQGRMVCKWAACLPRSSNIRGSKLGSGLNILKWQ